VKYEGEDSEVGRVKCERRGSEARGVNVFTVTVWC